MRAGTLVAKLVFLTLVLGGCVSQARYMELEEKFADRGTALARANAMMDEYTEKVDYLSFEIKAKETLLKKREEELALVSQVRTRIDDNWKKEIIDSLAVFQPDEGVTVDRKTGAWVLDGSVFFDSGSADIKSAAKKTLMRVAEMITKRGSPVQIVGHTDSDPISRTKDKWPYGNLQLSGARAMNVLLFLRDSGGVKGELMSYAGCGHNKPKVPNDTDQNKRQNRRVEILVANATE